MSRHRLGRPLLRADDLLATTDWCHRPLRRRRRARAFLLRATGRSLDVGGASAWTFLIHTPEMVEAGIRAVLAEKLGAGVVRKEGRQLVGSTLTFNPDLVFGAPDAVGDVKYKLAGGDWDRADLYQVVAFAAAFRVTEALLVRLRGSDVTGLRDVRVGDIRVREITWLADAQEPAEASAAALAADVREWLAATVEHGRLRLIA
jgi:5-methylcytosine-specific restriction enzyme subunit McrC